MTKEFARSQACAAKVLFAIMQKMQTDGGTIMSKDIKPYIESVITFTEWEKERAGKMQYVRWEANFQFYSIDYTKAGFIQKKNGYWYLTPEGEEAMKKGPEEVMRSANSAYKRWKADNDTSKPEPNDDTVVEVVENNLQINLDKLESEALEGIKEYLNKQDGYAFQDMVAALLRAMGYYTPFIAPKGKDGGIDIIAYLDPLGAKTPRIKVQVKHKPESAVPAADVRSLAGVLKTGDIGLFVTSGSFSTDAKTSANTNKEYIRIIDGDEFIDMWETYYPKMSDEDKNRLPLKSIAFLGSNE